MTVASELSKVSYAGSGTTGPFTVPFPFIVGSDLKVRVIDADGDITSIAGFTATGAGNPSGGAVTVPSPVPSGSEVEIYRDPPLTQTAAYTPNGSFPAKSHEQALDRLVMIDQRNRELILGALEILDAFSGDVAAVASAANEATTKAGVATTQAAAAVAAKAAAEAARDVAVATVSSKENIITPGSTTQLWRGDKTWVTATPALVGLGNVANKSEAQLVAAGAIADALLDRALWYHVPVDPRRYGADPTGVADSTSAIQACINANHVTQFGPGTYLVSGAVTVPTGKSVLGPIGGAGGGLIIKTGTTTGGFILAGSTVLMRGLRFEARHAGNLIVNNSYNSAVRDCFFQDTHSGGSPQPMIYSDASGFWFKDNQLSTSRGAASLMIDRNATRGLNIENHIYGNTWTGPGYGMWIGTTDGSPRPEGIKIINNTFACNSRQLEVHQCLMLQMIGNTFDQGPDRTILFYPQGEGIQNVIFNSNWVGSNGSPPVYGEGLYFDNAGGGATLNVKIIGNEIGYSSIGIHGTNALARCIISGNTFLFCGYAAVLLDQSFNVGIKDNHFESTGTYCMAIADGAAGGPFGYDGNFFDKPVSLTKTNPARFVAGPTNFGGSGWP